MKIFISLMLALFFSLSLLAQNEDTASVVKPRKTRTLTLEEVYTIDSTLSIGEFLLFEAFKGIGVEPVKEAYKLNRLAVDSVLAADSLNPTFWRVYGYQAEHLFVQANKSPQMAMSIFLPWFLLVFLIVVVVLFVKTFFIHTRLLVPEQPENDTIKLVDKAADKEQTTEDENVEDGEPPENGGEEAGQIQ